MTDQSNRKHPDEVRCAIMRDGGALVSAQIDYINVFSKAFADESAARKEASELFFREFDVLENNDPDIPL